MNDTLLGRNPGQAIFRRTNFRAWVGLYAAGGGGAARPEEAAAADGI
jgi:hypothetical protein